MNINKIIITLVVLTCSFLLFNNTPVVACSCENVPLAPGEKSIIKPSSNIFAGKAINVVMHGKGGNIVSFSTGMEPVERDTTFQVSKVWKGSAFKTFVVHNVSGCCLSGSEFELNREYIVYASESNNQLNEDRSVPINGASKDLQELGVGKIPVTENPSRSINPLLFFLPIIIGVVSVITYLITKSRKNKLR
jgi:hypothetical protein